MINTTGVPPIIHEYCNSLVRLFFPPSLPYFLLRFRICSSLSTIIVRSYHRLFFSPLTPPRLGNTNCLVVVVLDFAILNHLLRFYHVHIDVLLPYSACAIKKCACACARAIFLSPLFCLSGKSAFYFH